MQEESKQEMKKKTKCNSDKLNCDNCDYKTACLRITVKRIEGWTNDPFGKWIPPKRYYK